METNAATLLDARRPCTWRALAFASTVFAPLAALAQTADPGPGLVGLQYANDIEQAAAIANQQVFDALDASCNPGGVFDTVPEPGAPPVGTACSNEDRFFVYLNARELFHSANELRDQGPTSRASASTKKDWAPRCAGPPPRSLPRKGRWQPRSRTVSSLISPRASAPCATAQRGFGISGIFEQAGGRPAFANAT